MYDHVLQSVSVFCVFPYIQGYMTGAAKMEANELPQLTLGCSSQYTYQLHVKIWNFSHTSDRAADSLRQLSTSIEIEVS